MYDYIIVGAGSAGCVLAARLTEAQGRSVLLVEAGGPDSRREISIPAAFNKLFKSDCDWAYETEPQEQLNGRRIFWPRGKVLGGSSAINAMIYSRGNAGDHDAWSSLGIAGWSYDEVLPYYRKSEHNERIRNRYHGQEGPLNVSDPRYLNPLTQLFIESAQGAGIPFNDDFNGAAQEGVGPFQVTLKNGRRHSAAQAFLKPAMGRPNLTVRTGALVSRVLFEGSKAIGVELIAGRGRETLRAAREVILGGGAVNSPQLLMLSGIGPADHLRKMDINVVADLPGVGRNLQDHPLIGVEFECRRKITLHKADNLPNILKYLLLGKGPLSSTVAEAGAFIRTRSGLSLPDVELIFAPVFYMDNGFDNPDLHGFSLGIAIQHPESRGEITLRSKDPEVPPLIQPNYFSSESDLTSGVEGVRIAREILNTAAFAEFRGREWWPGEDARTAEDIVAHIRRTSQTIYHPVGTCRMGNDPMAVVDDNLRVIGFQGLRVVDASVIPIQITGHTHAPAMMIAEKAADLIAGN